MTLSIDEYTVDELRKFVNEHNIAIPTSKNGNITKEDLLKALTGKIKIGSSPINDNWINIVDWANSKLLHLRRDDFVAVNLEFVLGGGDTKASICLRYYTNHQTTLKVSLLGMKG